MHFSSLLFLSTAICLSGCVSVTNSAKVAEELSPGDPSAPSQVTPTEALAIAHQFTSHSWRPYAKNILHGKDKRGVLVHTPDAGFTNHPERPGWWVPGEVNNGMPYKWGGFDTIASFDTAVATGFAAGDVSTPEKRRLDNAAVSTEAAGVDCSGFVSRCLKLPSVYDTTHLPSVCTILPGAFDLRPGDLLNIPRGHVLLCAGWVDSDRKWIYYYETGGAPEYWKPGLKQSPIDALFALGYQPLRYRGMAREARIDGKQVLSRATREAADLVTNPAIGEP
jgi:hypothetical protein